MIKLKRHKSYADALRKYRVIIDGNEEGKIRRGELWTMNKIEKGNHTIWLKIDWCRSNKLNFDYTGDQLDFECGSNLTGFKVLLSIVYIFLPSKWCWIKQMNTEPGESGNGIRRATS